MYKLNIFYVQDLIKADDCILIISQEAGCHGHGRAQMQASVDEQQRNCSQSRTNSKKPTNRFCQVASERSRL